MFSGIPGYSPSVNALGKLSVSPSVAVPQGTSEQVVNQRLGERQMPVIPPKMMNDALLAQLMTQHNLSGLPMSAARNVFSLETLATGRGRKTFCT
jgi:hypothetical protein